MKNTILCSSNPILIKNLYGLLRDEGYEVELAEHPADAVQMVLARRYEFIIMDSEPFGLSAEDALDIIRTLRPAMPILFVGHRRTEALSAEVESPVDLEEVKRMIRNIGQMA